MGRKSEGVVCHHRSAEWEIRILGSYGEVIEAVRGYMNGRGGLKDIGEVSNTIFTRLS